MADSVSAGQSTSRVYSSSLLDVCRHVCEECGDEVEYLEHHVLEEHQGVDQGSNEFSLERDFDIQRWHKCSVCGEDIYFNRSNLKTHLKQHNLSFKDYVSDHLSRDIIKSENTEQDNELDNEEDEEDDDNDDDDVEEVREEDREFSNSFSDIIKVKCSICGNDVEEDEFKNLHLDTHGVKLKEYYAKYGRPEPTKKIYHKCQICQKILLFTRSSLSLHICQYHKMKMKLYSQNFMKKPKSEAVHSEAGDECTELYSNDYKDECTAVCKICNKLMKLSVLEYHISNFHKLEFVDYKANHGEVELKRKTYHKCGICHQILLLSSPAIKKHAQSKHKLTLKEYNKQFMLEQNIQFSQDEMVENGSKRRKKGEQKAPQWCDGTMYKCPFCFVVYYRYFTFRIHLINSHKMTDTLERTEYVKHSEIITDNYTCKLCSASIKRDRMDIEAHLKDKHKTTLRIYAENFESNDSKEPFEKVVERLLKEGKIGSMNLNLKIEENIKKEILETDETKPELLDNHNDNLDNAKSVSEKGVEEKVLENKVVASQSCAESTENSMPPTDSNSTKKIAEPSLEPSRKSRRSIRMKAMKDLLEIKDNTSENPNPETNKDMSAVSLGLNLKESTNNEEKNDPNASRNSSTVRTRRILLTPRTPSTQPETKISDGKQTTIPMEKSVQPSRLPAKKLEVSLAANPGSKTKAQEAISTEDSGSQSESEGRSKRTRKPVNRLISQEEIQSPKLFQSPKNYAIKSTKSTKKIEDIIQSPLSQSSSKLEDPVSDHYSEEGLNYTPPTVKHKSHFNRQIKFVTDGKPGSLVAKSAEPVKKITNVETFTSPNSSELNSSQEKISPGGGIPKKKMKVKWVVRKDLLNSSPTSVKQPSTPTPDKKKSSEASPVPKIKTTIVKTIGISETKGKGNLIKTQIKNFDQEGKENKISRKRPRPTDDEFSPNSKGAKNLPTSEPLSKRPKRVAATRIKNYAETFGTYEELPAPTNELPIHLKQEYSPSKPTPTVISSNNHAEQSRSSESTVAKNNQRISTTPMTPSQATKKNSKSAALKDKNKTSLKTPYQPTSLISVGAIKKEPVSTEGESMYRCPKKKCDWKCTQDGLQTGSAVLHLLRVHGVQPVEMRRQGLKFEVAI